MGKVNTTGECKIKTGQECGVSWEDSNIPNLPVPDRDYKCDLCCKSFGHVGSLKRHLKTIHEGEKDHLCTVCNKAFTQPGSLKLHVKTVHEGVRQHQCTVCGKSFGEKKVH